MVPGSKKIVPDGTDSLCTFSPHEGQHLWMRRARDLRRFGDAVRRARAAVGLTQEGLAERAGIDRSYIGGVERGERNPTLSVIARIADSLGLSLAELFSYSDKEPRA